MNLTSLTSLFSKKNKTLKVPDSLLVKRLKELSQQSNLHIYKDVVIYHHTKSYQIPLMVLDHLRGIYIFEHKEWTFDELKNADIQKAECQEASSNTLAFENTHNIIRKKFNELIHNDGVPIFNYLLMENLNTYEYEHLTYPFKELIPQEKVIFSDSMPADIFKKLQAASDENHNLPSVDTIIGTLLVQYAIIDEKNDIHALTQEQMAFIDKELGSLENLNGLHGSGKSSLLLLKAMVEVFNKQSQSIIIIKPTILSCDIFKKKLLEMVERAIIEIDLTLIEIITPLELLNRHQDKLGRDRLSLVEIDDKLMKKSFKVADLIMCDDADIYLPEFLPYLKHIQKNSSLLLVNEPDDSSELLLNKNFRLKERTVSFHKTNPHAKALHLIASLINKNATDILVVSNTLSRQKLKDDLEHFIENEPNILDSTIHLNNQKDNNLSLCTYKDINALNSKHIILMDLCFTSKNEIEYAFNLSTISVDILYEEDCQEIKNLRSQYESNQERSSVEGSA
ncbi:MAG: hypothetical protein U9N39_07275 [Campylobacterota bacterium]|nr:hypothetical protein [Campylobacterota bacterium]